MVLLLQVMACGGADRADAGANDETGADSAEDTAPPVEGLPEDPVYWEGIDPLEGLVLPETIPSIPHWEVRLATRADATAAWEPDPRVLAVAFSSLSAIVVPSGSGGADRLVITGNVDHEQARALGVTPPIGTVYALWTTDLATWDDMAWPVAEATHTFVIDPALYAGGDGTVGAVWYATSEAGGDPATFPGDHELRTGHWRDGVLVEDEGDAAFAWPLLADPVICPLGTDAWLFATSASSDILLARAPAEGPFTLAEASLWPGPSVPSCRESDGAIELIVQSPGGGEPPEVARLDADGTLTRTGPLYPEHPWGTNCTSPSVVAWGGQDVLVCAVFED